MNTHATLEALKDLPLHGMIRSYEAVLQLPVDQQPESHSLPAQLSEAEQPSHSHYRTPLCLKHGKPRYAGLPQQLSFWGERNLSKEEILPPDDCSFIDRAENILMNDNGRLQAACHSSFTCSYLTYRVSNILKNHLDQVKLTPDTYSTTRTNTWPSILSITNF